MGQHSNTVDVIGRSCRLPSAGSIEEFRRLLFSSRCAVREIPAERWRARQFYHPEPGVAAKSYCSSAGLVENIFSFDPKVFGISPREAKLLDPQQRLLLMVVWEALEDAGIVPSDISGSDVGVFVGASTTEHGTVLANDPEMSDPYAMTGNALSLIANRVSHVFNWHGPSMTIDTACSSSLYALAAAKSALERGEVDLAVVGATNALLSPNYFAGFSAARMLSPSGLCQAFSANADGYVRGEGAIAFVLQRAEDRCGQAHGQIRHVELNTSGQTVNIALPSGAAQRSLLRAAYEKSGIEPDQLAFVEAHGTGTRVGDPIEADALGQELGLRRSAALRIGSVKSNIGHLEPAAGCAGLLKSMLALEAGILPATLHAEKLNADIPFDDLNLDVVTRPVSLEGEGEERFAGVSSFGFGGANSHCVLSYTPPQLSSDPRIEPVARPVLLTSAHCEASLIESLAAYSDVLDARQEGACLDIFDGALHQRGRYPYRAAVIAECSSDVSSAVEAAKLKKAHPALVSAETQLDDAPIVFLFSGNGAQFVGMCRDALERDDEYRAAFMEVSALWEPIAGWSLFDMVYAENLDEKLPRAPVAQPLLFADQVAMVRALAARGVLPSAVIGHSGGEVAAAHVSGALSLEDAIRLNFVRSGVQNQLYGRGTMAAVQGPSHEVAKVIAEDYQDQIALAAVNSPRSVSIVGPADAINAFVRDVRKRKSWASVRLKFDYPFHSPMQDEIKDELVERLRFLQPRQNDIEFISSVEGAPVSGEHLNEDYWWRNVRQTVLFDDAISYSVSQGHNCFLEVGPDPVLKGYVRTRLSEAKTHYSLFHSGDRKDKSSTNPVVKTLARALCNGAKVDLNCISQFPKAPVRSLPLYPFQTEEFSALGSATVERLTGRSASYHPLLGVADDNSATAWHNDIDAKTQVVFADHVLSGRAILPGSAMVEMALAAVKRSQNIDVAELYDVDLFTPVPLSSPSMSQVRTKVSDRHSSVQIATRPRFDEGDWTENANIRFVTGTKCGTRAEAPDLAALHEEGGKLYRLAQKVGLDYGPAFARVEKFQKTDDGVVEVFLSDFTSAHYDPSEYELDPVGMDAVLHGMIAYVDGTAYADQGLGFVPSRAERVKMSHPGQTISSGRLTITKSGVRSLLADVEVFNSDGLHIGTISGLRFKAVRLFSPISFETQSFRIERQVLTASEQMGLSQEFATEFEHHIATSGGAALEEDDAEYLLDAAARRIWYDAFDQCSLDDAVDQHDLSPWVKSYRNTAMQRLAACGFASVQSGVFELNSEIDLPEADALIAGVLAERPDLVGECAILAALGRTLPALLDGTISGTPQSVFGLGALKMVKEHSALLLAERAALLDAAQAALRTADLHRSLRVAELTLNGRPAALRQLYQEGACKNWSFTHITTSEDQRAFDVPRFGLALPDIKTVKLAEIDRHEPMDLIVCQDAWAAGDVNLDLEKVLAARLREGGVALLLSPLERDHRRAMSFAASDLDLRVEDQATPSTVIERSVADLAGASILKLVAPKAETHPTADLLWAVRPDMAVEDAITVALNLHLGDNAEETIEADVGIKTFTADGEGKTFLYCSSADSDAQLSARILHIGNMLEHAAPDLAGLVFVIPGGSGLSSNVPEPAQAALWAFLRTARNEYPEFSIQSVDFDPNLDPSGLAKHLAQLAQVTSSETEVHIGRDGLGVARVKCGAVSSGYKPLHDMPVRSRLTADPAGGLDRLRWQLDKLPDLKADDVRVEVSAVGLNYRDVMWAMDLLPEEALEDGFAGPNLGIECAGRVVAIGQNVSELEIGDRVVTFGPGCFSSHLDVASGFCAKLPDHIDDAAAATIPVTFFTAFHSLVTLANLQPGETVLIHGGAGGVGLAAIQVANKCGARVIATAGSPAKQALLESLGVEHVLDSRSLEFADDVRRLTGGAGVDVILNSIAKVGMEQSLGLVKPFGRFLELGKQDFYTSSSIGLRPLRKNVQYLAVDIDQYIAAYPDRARMQFQQLMREFEHGSFAPLPHTAFESPDVVEAFRVMQRSEHIGKVVVRPAPVAAVQSEDPDRMMVPDTDSWTVITGGASGIGLTLADRLIEKGAKHIALLGRSDRPSEIAQAFIERESGVNVKYLSCDVTDKADLDQALGALRADRKITGVIHSAMVLEDMRIRDLEPDAIARVLGAKTVGTRNLDTLTRQDTLKYFVAFTSMATLIGNHGQAAYVAGNAYLEAIIRDRRANGLPGLAVGWGAISDVGYLTRDDKTAEILRRFAGGVEFTSNQMSRVFEQLAKQDQRITDQATLWVSPMSWTAALQALSIFDSPMYETLAHLGTQTATSQEYTNLRDHIVVLPLEEATEKAAHFLQVEMARILRCPKDQLPLDQPIGDFGLDSLMGVELGLSVQQALGGDVPIAGIATSLSINEIARMVVNSVRNMDQYNAADTSLMTIAHQHLGDLTHAVGVNDATGQDTVRTAV